MSSSVSMVDDMKYNASSPRNYSGSVPTNHTLATHLTGEANAGYRGSGVYGGESPNPRPRLERKRVRGKLRWVCGQMRPHATVERLESLKRPRPSGYEKLLTPPPTPHGSNRSLPVYTHCFAFFIVFEFDNLGGCLTEAEDFSKELKERWGFDTTIYKIPFLDSPKLLQENVENAICDFINVHDGDDHLLLFHYGGHGSFNPQGEYTLAMGHKARHYEIRFRPIREHLLNCKSDVAIFLDACYAAAGISRNYDTHTVEVLAACDIAATTPAVGLRSFTSKVLQVLCNYTQETLILEDLCEELRKLNGLFPRKAIYFPLKQSLWGSITLRRSGKSCSNPETLQI